MCCAVVLQPYCITKLQVRIVVNLLLHSFVIQTRTHVRLLKSVGRRNSLNCIGTRFWHRCCESVWFIELTNRILKTASMLAKNANLGPENVTKPNEELVVLLARSWRRWQCNAMRCYDQRLRHFTSSWHVSHVTRKCHSIGGGYARHHRDYFE